MSFALAVAIIAQAAGVSPIAPLPPACSGAVYAEFDFWVGDWDVYPRLADQSKAPLVAHSRIEKLYGGCAVRENWMPLKGAGGGSLNAPDPQTGRWHQYWLDETGARVDFDGGPAAGGMVLMGYWRGVNGPGKDGLIRMTYTAIDRDTVRQHGEISTDHGLSWSESFDLLYLRSKAGG
ncbi:MAG: hypothetical protein WBL74_04125 [Novosphingobium sp.]|uniref:hypothetical protein n=1 Tax=Novosphingobium sp. TaxID=1874826 RepID=UPI003C7A35B4